MNDYRKIYESHFGSIPVDESGETYQIHHVDGDHFNNDIDNLVAITIDEHFKIHFDQKDYHACFLIASKMNLSSIELSEIASLLNKLRIENKTHPFLEGNAAHRKNTKKLSDGTHHLLRRSDGTSHATDRVDAGVHHFLGGDVQRNRVANGSHPSQEEWTCDHCGKSGKGKMNFTRWHGDNCKSI